MNHPGGHLPSHGRTRITVRASLIAAHMGMLCSARGTTRSHVCNTVLNTVLNTELNTVCNTGRNTVLHI